MSNFKIGQRVVCVKACGSVGCWSRIEVDTILTISELSGNIANFVEKNISNKPVKGGIGLGYLLTNFKPLDESFAEEVEANIAKMVEEEQMVEI